ncbi:hypothetical protein A946_09435 [Methylacidiphilum kamchatkense Kam1]|nr:hypothetical protein [Methylacidiphilum kamchatkense]KIE58111.1 hypothetical protein A946_09435 [Methylacidiphilum kamchatkense Kam1]
MKKVGYVLIFFALVWIGGGHLLILQSIAWSKMFCYYSQKVSWPKAIQKTLAGKGNCQICEKIPRSFDNGPFQSNQTSSLEKEVLFVSSLFLVFGKHHSLDSYLPYLEFSYFSSYRESPPTPPPKYLFV